MYDHEVFHVVSLYILNYAFINSIQRIVLICLNFVTLVLVYCGKKTGFYFSLRNFKTTATVMYHKYKDKGLKIS